MRPPAFIALAVRYSTCNKRTSRRLNKQHEAQTVDLLSCVPGVVELSWTAYEMGQGYQPNGPMKSGQMGMQVKANDMTGVPIELQTWSGMQARMDPDRARIQQRRIERTKNTENYIRARQENLAALRQMRIELAARATKAGSQVVSKCCI